MAKPYDVLAIGVAAIDDLLYISSYPQPNVKVSVTTRERHGEVLLAQQSLPSALFKGERRTVLGWVTTTFRNISKACSNRDR